MILIVLSFICTTQNIKDSVQYFYFDSGEIQREVHYKKGEICKNIAYFKSGTILSEFNYHNGTKDSIFRYYFPNGNISVEGYFKNDVLHGAHKLYYKSGNLKSKTNYCKGLKCFQYLEYYDSGANYVKVQGNYNKDLKEGKWLLFGLDGMITEEHYYKTDSLVEVKQHSNLH